MSPTFDVLTPMTNVYYREDWIDRDQDARIGNSEIQEFSGTTKELYRAMQKEYGRCAGYVYIDRKDEPAAKVGWVFLQRVPYDERESYGHHLTKKNTYLRETWVTCYEGKPTVIQPKRLRIA